MASSRIPWRMSADGLLPAFLAKVAPGGSPWRSVAAVAVVSAVFAGTGGYEEIVRIYAPWSIGSILVICLSSFWLRIKEPDLARPYRAPLFPWITLFACAVQAALIVIVVIDDRASAVWSALVVVAPLPLYLFFTRRRRIAAAP